MRGGSIHAMPICMSIAFAPSAVTHRRGLLLLSGLLAAFGGAVIHLAPLPALWRTSWPYGLVFALLGVAQLASVGAVLVRPDRRRLQYAAGVSLSVIALWLLTRWHVLSGPNPWTPASSALGITGHLDLALQATATAVLAGVAFYGPRPRPGWKRRALTTAATIPLTLVVLLASGLGIAGAGNGFTGAGFPSGTVALRDLPTAGHGTDEYCHPDGVRLAMDIYTPPAGTNRPWPVAVYIHGGGLVLGDRKLKGLGANLAEHQAALFTPLQQQLNSRGYVVAAIDYRLLPAGAWPAPLTDVKCAIRFLRAHATDLGIDPDRIGVWGTSAGGHLAALLGLAAPAAGFDAGEYAEQSSAVQAVVDMFGPTDFTNFGDASPFGRFIVEIGLGSSVATRRSASPITYVRPGAPPFLILHGGLDTDIPIGQSKTFAQQLHAAGVPTTFVEVQGTAHTLNTPGQQPTPDQITTMVVGFFTTNLH